MTIPPTTFRYSVRNMTLDEIKEAIGKLSIAYFTWTAEETDDVMHRTIINITTTRYTEPEEIFFLGAMISLTFFNPIK